MLQRTEC
jgi:hypothetical protein